MKAQHSGHCWCSSRLWVLLLCTVRDKAVPVAFSLCSGSGNDNSNICSTPFLRKTYSYRPSCKTDVYPFRFCIFLSADNFWYIRLSQVVFKAGLCHRTHTGHPKLLCSDTKTRASGLSEEEIEKLQDHSGAHLSSTQSAHLFNLGSNHNLLPYQVKYLARKAVGPSSKLTADASSADQLLSYLDSRYACIFPSVLDLLCSMEFVI